MAACQVLEFTRAVSFMEIDYLIYVWEVLEFSVECRHRNIREVMREAEHLHMYGDVQGKGQFSMQMSSSAFILFNTSQTVSIRPRFNDYKSSVLSKIPQSCYLKIFLLTIIISII